MGVRFFFFLFCLYCAQAQEGQPQADLGNGMYQNPIIPGRYADPSVVKVNSDYYMTHSMGGTPSLLIWHSRDLVSWKPIGYAATAFYGDSWAPDIAYKDGTFYIYTTFVDRNRKDGAAFQNFVMTATNPAGPWSKPVNLNIDGKIDPGHLFASDGKRYLYFNKGDMVELDATGTRVISTIKNVYQGWSYPDEWITECFCLEGPKLFKKGSYYYMVSAQGGTAGPATSHMAVVARAKTPEGPWENSPFNPLIKTWGDQERWWSQGHATLLPGPDGNWYAIFHAYEKDHRPLGRQTLLLPLTWTEDGWPVNRNEGYANGFYPKPSGGQVVTRMMRLSDAFESDTLGMQWRSYTHDSPRANFKLEQGKLFAKAKGDQLGDAVTLGILPVNHSYDVTVQVELSPFAAAGLVIAPQTFNQDADQINGIGIKGGDILVHSNSKALGIVNYEKNSIYLKLAVRNNAVILSYGEDGDEWKVLDRKLFIAPVKSAAVMLYAYGRGEVKFDDFTYQGLN